MTVDPANQQTTLQIQRYKGFKEDPVFKGAIESLSKQGKKWESILDPECDKSLGSGTSKAMDHIFFKNDRFELVLDTKGYNPEDLKCTIIGNVVEVAAKRQEAGSGASRTLSMSRTYQLPHQIRTDQANCCLSTEGVLLITAPWSGQG